MKKIILRGLFLAFVSTSSLYAADDQQPTNDTNATPDAAAAPSTPAQAVTQTSPQTPPEINCDYTIPENTKNISKELVLTWAKNAAKQSFNFDHKQITQQITNLQKCYTEQGWKGYSDALEKSGNLTAIKNQNLNVSSTVSGQPTLKDVQENQWKVSIPMQVVYQNDKEKLTQELNVDLLIGRKTDGNLGVMQLIAMPVKQQQQTEPNEETESAPANQTSDESANQTNN